MVQLSAASTPPPALTLDEVVRDMEHLPSAPRVLPRLKHLLCDGNTAMAEVVEMIRLDPGIAARVLQFGNSAYFSHGVRCYTVDEAVNRVGYDQIYELVAGAVASRYLAVGTPRSLAVIGDGLLSIEAHTTWFTPRDLRSTTGLPGTREVPLAEALTADIVCIHEPLAIPAGALRRGTHVNALAAITLPEDLVAQRYDEAKDLPALAAGLIDGRVLDELTIFRAVR